MNPVAFAISLGAFSISVMILIAGTSISAAIRSLKKEDAHDD